MDMLKQEPLIIINACSNKPHCRLPTLPTASICPGPGIIKMKSAILTRQTGQNKSTDPILLCARIFTIFIVFFLSWPCVFFSFLLFHFDVRSYFDSFVRGTCGPINNTGHRPWLIFPEQFVHFWGPRYTWGRRTGKKWSWSSPGTGPWTLAHTQAQANV